jgi:hypothetical protein
MHSSTSARATAAASGSGIDCDEANFRPGCERDEVAVGGGVGRVQRGATYDGAIELGDDARNAGVVDERGADCPVERIPGARLHDRRILAVGGEREAGNCSAIGGAGGADERNGLHDEKLAFTASCERLRAPVWLRRNPRTRVRPGVSFANSEITV